MCDSGDIAEMVEVFSACATTQQDHIKVLETENLQLKARVAKFDHLAKAFCYHGNHYGKYPDDVYEFTETALNHSPAQSLAEHDAEVLERTAEKLCGDSEPPTANRWIKRMLTDEANNIRKEVGL